MLPLVGLAVSFIPELVHLIAGDKAGSVASDAAKIVQSVTQTADPGAAQQKLLDDAGAAAELRIKLAALAIDAAKTQNAEAENGRQAELSRLRAGLADVSNSRSTMLALAQSGNSIAWGAPAISIIVIVGFFVLLTLLLTRSLPTSDPNIVQVLNLAVGSLLAAFSTVVSYWIGSSQGSRNKDDTIGALVTSPSVPPPQPPPLPAPVPTPRSADIEDGFLRCLAVVLASEGGFSNNPSDPGGATNFGITQKTLAQWRDVAEVPVASIQGLTQAEAAEIYRATYWLPMGCSHLPSGIDLVVFDLGVNAGTKTSVRLLQKIVGVTQDGSVGPMTLAAVKRMDPKKLIEAFSDGRLAYYRSLDGFATFGKGWEIRTARTAATATLMVAA